MPRLSATDNTGRARAFYEAFAAGEREVPDALLAEDFEFFSPADPGIDRGRWFEVCWPNAGNIASYDFVRLVEMGEEVLVTYDARRTDGSRFRNTEVLTFEGERLRRAEVYFGWELAEPARTDGGD